LTYRLTLVPRTSHADLAPGSSDRPVAYDVSGLPPELAVEIAEIDQRWQLMVVRDGFAGEWEGDFDSADEALAALQREIDGLR
jgi:hypothetical protein